MAYNLIRGNIAESANRHNKIPRRISFKSAVQLLDAARIKVGNLSLKIIRNAYETLLKIIASTSTEKRNRPPQPRAIKRRPKAYPLLTVPRAEACVGLRSVKF
jgi:DNA topoisomerase IB